jgi:hypothetical protein
MRVAWDLMIWWCDDHSNKEFDLHLNKCHASKKAISVGKIMII